MEGAIEEAIHDNNPDSRALRAGTAADNSWQKRIETIESTFDKHIYHFRKSAEKPVVMHLIAAMDIAGAENVVLNLLCQRDISPFDLRVTSFVRMNDGKGTDFLRAAAGTKTTIDRIPMYRRWDLRDVGSLMRIIKRHGVQLLHTHGYKSDIVGVIASRLTGVPLVATAHGFTAADSRLQHNEKLDRFFLRFAKRVICVSDDIRELLLRSGLPDSRTQLLPNGVDFDYFAEDAEANFRTDWEIGEREVLIGTAGRLSVEKGQINLVKAFALLPPEIRNNCRLVIAGSGPEENVLRSTAVKLGLETSVTLTSFISDMRSFYQAVDIFCLPSLREASPLTILEAAASHKPVVATKVGSVKTLIKDARDGYLTEPGDVNELSSALKQLIVSENQRKSFGRRLGEKLSPIHDVRAWAQKVFAVYDEFIS